MPAEQSEASIARARALRQEGRYEEALAAYRAAAEGPLPDFKALQNMATLLADLGRFEEAEAALRRTLEVAPADAPTRLALASALLAQGRYAEGWSFYDARFEAGEPGNTLPDLAAPRWRSFHPAGKRILVIPEQGFGDQIQFVRFVPGLAAAGARVFLLAKPPLYRLFRDSLRAATVIELEGTVSFPPPDFYVLSNDLPGLAGVTADTIPSAPYLAAPPPPLMLPLPDRPRIGIMTRGNPALKMDGLRSLPPAAAERLRRALPGTVVDLAPEATGARDFADTAALIGALDLVISVDTAVAHLAGALGKPCLTLLRSFGGDWRWPRMAPSTPWYPSMRLFWAGLDGDWEAAIDGVVAAAGAEQAR